MNWWTDEWEAEKGLHNCKLYWTFFVLASAVTVCISVSGFCFFPWYSYRNYEFCNIKNLCNDCRIKKYKSIIQKKKKKCDKIVLLAKTKFNSMEVLISKALINSNISHDEFALVNVLKEYEDMKIET